MNTTQYDLDKTAKTSKVIAKQRAENLYLLNVNSVLELCVGPSSEILRQAYNYKYGISFHCNDIDRRWKEYSPHHNWLIGDCFDITYGNVDAVVFAPPLSKGCSGKREDSLSIDEVSPKYIDFIKRFESVFRCGNHKVAVLVLPARSLSTKEDRKQFYRLLKTISLMNLNFEVVEMYDKVRKYIDIYITRK